MKNEEIIVLENAICAVIGMLIDNKSNEATFTAGEILREWDRLRGRTWFYYNKEES